jgi:hypothetical protein
MTPWQRFLMLAVLACGLAGCADAEVISPNDPEYARSGAPRAAGEYQKPPRGPYMSLGSMGGGH